MLRRTLAVLVSTTLIVSAVAATAPAATAAPEAPATSSTAVDQDGDITLTWAPADGASAYSLQVATDPSFVSGSILTTVATYNVSWVIPTSWSTTEDRTLYWRVASYGTGTTSSTLGAYSAPTQLDITAGAVPTLLGPGSATGGVVTYPDPVVFSWEPVAGAQLYRLQYASDAGFTTDLKTYTTTGTTYTPATPLARESGGFPITWHWRVQAVLYTGVTAGTTGPYSQPWEFRVEWPASASQPTLTSPANWVAGAPGVSDVKLTWTPVAGASRYEVVIGTSRSDDGTSVTSRIQEASGTTPFTTWVPTIAFADRNFFWQVIPYDLAGNPGTASEVRQFRKLWGGQTGPQTAPAADATYPAPLVGGPQYAPTPVSIDDFELSWDPVPRATLYEVQVVPHNGDPRLTCRTASTSATIVGYVAAGAGTPGALVGQSQCLWNGDAAKRIAPGRTYTWRVRAIDYSGKDTTALSASTNPVGTLVSAWSDPEESGASDRERWIEVTSPRDTSALDVEPDTTAWATGTAVAGQPSPTFSWNTARYWKKVGGTDTDPELELTPVDGYEVTVALNPDMTNPVSVTRTPSTRLRINGVFGDNETGMPYYWQVRPFWTQNWTAVTYTALGSATKPSWTKTSTATSFFDDETTRTVSADGTIVFAWRPQADTAPADGGSRGYQVTLTTSGGTLVGTQKIEYPYFVAVNPKTEEPLAPGSYKLTVAPLDANGSPGRPSRTIEFSTATPAPHTPTSRTTAAGATLSWQTSATASRYEVQYWAAAGSEITVSKLGTESLAQGALSLTDLSAGTYGWRVRSIDTAGNASPWSTGATFAVGERRPTLRTPVDDVLTTSTRVLDWAPVEGASRYLVQVATTSGGLASAAVVETIASAYAPTTVASYGTTYYWRVRAVGEKYGSASRPVLGESTEGRYFTRTAPAAPATTTPTLSTGGLTYAWTPLTGAAAGSDDTVEYVVRYRVKQTPEATWTYLDAITGSNVAVSGLASSTTYQFEVAGRTSEGQGPWSRTSEKTTASVPSAPATLTLTSKLRSLDVAWAKPVTSGASLTAITLRYRLTTSSTWTTVALPASATKYTITGLSALKKYRVEVAGQNVVGTGLPATGEQMALGTASAPRSLAAKSGDRKVTLTWSAPSSLGGDLLSEYVVQMRSYSATTKTWSAWVTKTTTPSRSATISSLVNGAKYQFRVLARTLVAKDGTASSAVSVVPAGKPLAPTGVSALATGSSRIKVSWAKANANGSTISGYTVQYSTNGTTWRSLKTTTASTTSWTWSSATRGKTYYFRVIAKSNLGNSPASSKVRVVAR
ncbi:fibronectin type III domain-containing protein [Cellulomonas sp. CW35]|uniref:fibronectin type III domain-containing protein n=1 Tax=Cellulomonas sp. CW35 TaxID=3458249 RepID=UPI0040340B56